MAKFRKKPVVIEAVQFKIADGIYEKLLSIGFPQNATCEHDAIAQTNTLLINTLEGVMRAQEGDFIIKGVNGEFYPCKPDIFAKTYEPFDEIINASDAPIALTFGMALEAVKQGKRIARTGWNGKGMFVVYQKGYPQGIPCNEQTAKAWGMEQGELFRCEPYLQIKMVNGSHAMWVPSINDVLAEDWQIVD